VFTVKEAVEARQTNKRTAHAEAWASSILVCLENSTFP